jgi:cell division protein FtsB
MVALSLLAFIAYAAMMLRGPQGLAALNQNRSLVRQLESQNQDLRNEIEAKTKRIEKLTNDPNQQEIEIRKRLDMQKSDETIFKSTTPTPTTN